MIDEIIKLKEAGLSFRKIAAELDTTVGKVQYRWNKWLNKERSDTADSPYDEKTPSSVSQTPEALHPFKDQLQAQHVSPGKIILFWEVSDLPQKIIQLFFEQPFEEMIHLIRIYDVTDIIFNGRNAHHFYEIAYPYDNGYWSVKGLPPNRSYLAELGVRFSGNDFFPIMRSNTLLCSMTDASTNKKMFLNLTQLKNLDALPPKWIDHVSTYGFYEDSLNKGEN